MKRILNLLVIMLMTASTLMAQDKKNFTLEDNENINAIYNSDMEYGEGYTVEEIIDDGIEIPRAW